MNLPLFFVHFLTHLFKVKMCKPISEQDVFDIAVAIRWYKVKQNIVV